MNTENPWKEEAVIHCIELMGLRNADQIVQMGNNRYVHTNTRGRKRLFTVYTCYEYFNSKSEEVRGKKLHKVMTYYITEETLQETSMAG